MPNFKLEIEYDGANYCGWQKQVPGAPKHKASIQGSIEKALRRILQEKVKLIASGRTDAGVHALAQVANFHTHSGISLERLQKALNSLLPQDIRIRKVQQAPDDFHSRYWAKSKQYRYTVLNRPFSSAFFRGSVYFCPYAIDVRLMQQEARILLGRHDFSAFEGSGRRSKNTVRSIRKIRVSKDKEFIHIDIEADGFLYNMARNIAGTLLEIGRGHFKAGSLKKILLSRDRKKAGPTAAPGGLCLVKVSY